MFIFPFLLSIKSRLIKVFFINIFIFQRKKILVSYRNFRIFLYYGNDSCKGKCALLSWKLSWIITCKWIMVLFSLWIFFFWVDSHLFQNFSTATFNYVINTILRHMFTTSFTVLWPQNCGLALIQARKCVDITEDIRLITEIWTFTPVYSLQRFCFVEVKRLVALSFSHGQSKSIRERVNKNY